MTTRLVLAIAALAVAAEAPAQEAPPVLAVANGDSVRIFVLTAPPAASGFSVSRRSDGGEFATLTESLVTPERDPYAFALRLGDDLSAIQRATSTEDVTALQRRLENDAFAAALLGYLHPRLAEVMGRTWAEGGLTRAATYTYRVDFVDGEGQVIDTHTTDVRIVDVLPVAPRELKTESGNAGVRLTWNYPPHRGDVTDLAIGFYVYRTAGNEALARIGNSMVLRDQRQRPVFDDFDAQPGVSYRYVVHAVDVLNREGPAGELRIAIADTTAPMPTPQVIAEAGNRRVSLVWAMAPEFDARGYFVERGTGLDEPFTRLNTAPVRVDQPAFTDTTALPDVRYFYRVVTVDSANNASVPSNVAAALPFDRGRPSPPRNLRVTIAAQRRLSISWTASPSTDVIGYNVYRRQAGREEVPITPRPVPGTQYLDPGPDSIGLEPGEHYRIAVSSVDGSANESDIITADVAVPDDEAPDAATGFYIENTQGRFATVRWSQGGSRDAARYELERTDGTGARRMLARVAANAPREVRDTALRIGERYVYSLVTIDTAGNRSVPAVDTLDFRDPTPPPAPRNAWARSGAGGTTISWERVVDRDLSGYMVYRSDLPTGVFTRLTPTPLKDLTFTDRGAAADMFYLVRAVDTSRNESNASPVVRAPQE